LIYLLRLQLRDSKLIFNTLFLGEWVEAIEVTDVADVEGHDNAFEKMHIETEKKFYLKIKPKNSQELNS